MVTADENDLDAQIERAGQYINDNQEKIENSPELKNLMELHKITTTLNKEGGAFDLLTGYIPKHFEEIITKNVQNNDPNTSQTQRQRTENEKKIQKIYGELNGLFKRNNIQQDIKKLQDELTNNKIQIDNEDERIKILEAVENLRIKIEQMYADIKNKTIGVVSNPASSKNNFLSSRGWASSGIVSTLASAFMGGGHNNTQKGRKGRISQRGRTQKRKKHT